MTHARNRSIPAAKAIDEYQDSISDPSVRAPRDISGYAIIGGLVSIPAIGIALALLAAGLRIIFS
jgi:hypothetical protein